MEAGNTGNLNRSLFPSCVLLHIQELMCTGAAWITSCSEYKNKGTKGIKVLKFILTWISF